MNVKKFFGMLESPLFSIYVDLYFSDDCENDVEMTADKVVEKYADREVVGFDVGSGGMSVTIEGGC